MFAMHRTSTNLIAKLDAIEANCKPQPFLPLALTARDFISAAGLLIDLDEESEFEETFNRLIALMVRFYGVFQQAHDMGLLLNVDESTKSAPRELRELDRALENQQRRLECIVAVCRLAEATACLIGIRRFPGFYFPWTQSFQLLLREPILSALFQDIDLAKWAPLKGESERRFAARAESLGFRPLGIHHCCQGLITQVGELWMDSLTHRLEESKLEACASQMRRVLNFLTMPAQERWILQELRSIGSTDSMQAILKEILRYDLRVITASDNLDVNEVGRFGGAHLDLPKNVFVLTRRWLNRQKYLVTVPDLSYFVDRLSCVSFESATKDPVQFLRANWRGAPRSVQVEDCRQQLMRIENAKLDTQFGQTLEHVIANLAGESFAYAISTSVGTSPEVSIFIAGCFGIAVDVAMQLRKR